MGSIDPSTASITAKYILKEAKTQEDIDCIMEVIWAANHTPYEPFVQLFFPVLGFTAADREASLSESKVRFWNQHLAAPSSNWFYVVEAETGKPVGCAQWEIHTSNPFRNGVPKLRAPWWPEGEHREFCESILNQVYKPRASWMRKPHLALNWMAVIPAHRHLGIASTLMTAGISRADELNLECWLEASSMGRPLYEKFGFQSLFKISFDTNKKDASDVWRKCEHEMTPGVFFPMWRPTAGEVKIEEGVFRMPWELGGG